MELFFGLESIRQKAINIQVVRKWTSIVSKCHRYTHPVSNNFGNNWFNRSDTGYHWNVPKVTHHQFA